MSILDRYRDPGPSSPNNAFSTPRVDPGKGGTPARVNRAPLLAKKLPAAPKPMGRGKK